MKKYVLNFFDPYVFHIFFLDSSSLFFQSSILSFFLQISSSTCPFFCTNSFPIPPLQNHRYYFNCMPISPCASPPSLPTLLLFTSQNTSIFDAHYFSIKILEGKKGVPAPATTICYRGRWQIVQLLYRN